jgi:hypothetical protein
LKLVMDSMAPSGMGNIHAIDVLPQQPEITPQKPSTTDGRVSLSWLAGEGLQYQVQYRDKLNSGSWSNWVSPITATNGIVTTSDLISTNRQRFYRVVLLP